jgi:hypothetical protein
VGMKRIEIQIDQLVLDGFAPADRLRIANSVKQELARIVAERGIEKPAAVSSKDPGSFRVAPHDHAEGIGRRAAQAIHGGLARKARR